MSPIRRLATPVGVPRGIEEMKVREMRFFHQLNLGRGRDAQNLLMQMAKEITNLLLVLKRMLPRSELRI